MKIISCPIPGKSLIVQFEPAASGALEQLASGHPGTDSHGLLLGFCNGNDPKWLHIHHIQPVFGFGNAPDRGPVAPNPPDPTKPLITLGYYTIRSNGENLDQIERDFLSTSLPPSAAIATVITGKDRRLLAQFYFRQPEGEFGPFPDHRQLLVSQEAVGPSLFPQCFVPAPIPVVEPDLVPAPDPPPARKSWKTLVVALAVAASLIALALTFLRPWHPQAAPVETAAPASVSALPLIPKPNFELPVRSVRQIQDPPEVAIWYPEPSAVATPVTGESTRAVLVHPILSQENPR